MLLTLYKGDISTPAERGGYMGVFSMGSMLGPLVGPFLGMKDKTILCNMLTLS
jgi:MFS family permease